MSVTRGGSEATAGALWDGDPEIGYRGPTACAAAGITYRQLDYWARTGLVEPSVRAAHGSGRAGVEIGRDVTHWALQRYFMKTSEREGRSGHPNE